MTGGLILPSVPCTQTSMCFSPYPLRTRARPSGWCNLNREVSVKIQCHQWRMSQTRWRLTQWRRCRRWNKISKAHRAWENDIPEKEDAEWWYTLTGDIQCWALNLGLDWNLLTCIIPSNFQSSWGVEILWRWPKGIRLGDPFLPVSFKILLMASCVTPHNRVISTCQHPSRKTQKWIAIFHIKCGVALSELCKILTWKVFQQM